MIKHLTLERFRGFRGRHEFEFAPLTILTGPNNSGKSSLLKSLLFLGSNVESGKLESPNFGGGDHNLGSYVNTLTHGSSVDDGIIIGFSVVSPDPISVGFQPPSASATSRDPVVFSKDVHEYYFEVEIAYEEQFT